MCVTSSAKVCDDNLLLFSQIGANKFNQMIHIFHVDICRYKPAYFSTDSNVWPLNSIFI